MYLRTIFSFRESTLPNPKYYSSDIMRDLSWKTTFYVLTLRRLHTALLHWRNVQKLEQEHIDHSWFLPRKILTSERSRVTCCRPCKILYVHVDVCLQYPASCDVPDPGAGPRVVQTAYRWHQVPAARGQYCALIQVRYPSLVLVLSHRPAFVHTKGK